MTDLVDATVLAALERQAADAEEFDKDMAAQKKLIDAQMAAAMGRLIGVGKPKGPELSEEHQALITLLTNTPHAVQLTPLVQVLLANPLLIPWALRTVQTKLAAVQQLLDKELS